VKKTAASERAKVYATQLSLVQAKYCQLTIDFLLRIFFRCLWKAEMIVHNKFNIKLCEGELINMTRAWDKEKF